MSRVTRNVLVAVLAAAPLGCTTSEPAPQQRPPASEGVYRRPPYVEPPPGSVAKDIPLYDYGRREVSSPSASQPPVTDDRPLIDTTGVKLGELPAVRAATIAPQHWQALLPAVEDRIDAPDLKTNARNGLTALAPRVARALIDFKGETAIVTIAVYRDPTTRPSTLPATNPATTQPAYKHAAIAIAFEGFAGQLDPSFIPRVLADQPRTPDDGREPIDFNLILDREASSYVLYQLSRDGLMAGQVSHSELRRDLADAVEKVAPATRPTTGQVRPEADSVAGIYEPLPAPGGVSYDTGEVWTTQRYGDYVYRGPDYYWGYGGDPYLYDLYGCRWGSPYWVTRSGYYYDDYYYGSGFWYGSGYYGYYGGYGHHHDDDDDDHHNGNNNGNGRPPVVVSDRSPRGKVPWGNAPIVSATNPPVSKGPTPLVIAAQPSGTPVRPAPTITGRPMRAPKEFVGPRSISDSSAGAPPAASFRTADGSVLVVPSKSSQAQLVDSSTSGDGGSRAPIIVPARRSSSAYVAPSGTYTPPPAQRPSARSTPSERINSAPRLGPTQSGNREFVGPRSSPGNDGGGGRTITGGTSGGGKSDGGGSGGGGKSGGGDGGGRSGGGGNSGGGGGKGEGGGRNR